MVCIFEWKTFVFSYIILKRFNLKRLNKFHSFFCCNIILHNTLLLSKYYHDIYGVYIELRGTQGFTSFEASSEEPLPKLKPYPSLGPVAMPLEHAIISRPQLASLVYLSLFVFDRKRNDLGSRLPEGEELCRPDQEMALRRSTGTRGTCAWSSLQT